MTTPPEKVSTEILYLLDNLYKTWIPYAKSFDDKVRCAVLFHISYEVIHPYSDGNGRSGRLLLDWILLQLNMAPITIRVEDRAQYYSFLRTNDSQAFSTYLLEQIDYERLLLNRNGEVV